MLTPEQYKRRYERLKLIDYQISETARDLHDEAAWKFVRPKIERVNFRLQQFFERYEEQRKAFFGALTHSVSWCPIDAETYEVERLVLTGEGADEIRLTRTQHKEISKWKPLENAVGDSESGQGWIYCHEGDTREVMRRIKLLEPDSDPAAVRQDSESVLPPIHWKTEPAYARYGRGERVNLSRTLAEIPVQEDAPKSVSEILQEILLITEDTGECAYERLDEIQGLAEKALKELGVELERA